MKTFIGMMWAKKYIIYICSISTQFVFKLVVDHFKSMKIYISSCNHGLICYYNY